MGSNELGYGLHISSDVSICKVGWVGFSAVDASGDDPLTVEDECEVSTPNPNAFSGGDFDAGFYASSNRFFTNATIIEHILIDRLRKNFANPILHKTLGTRHI
jgi:hypothetical protein